MCITRFGLREFILGTLSALLLVYSAYTAYRIYNMPILLWLSVIPVVLWLWLLWFFRDPGRVVPAAEGLIVSPADGVVTHIDEVEEADFIGGKALRLSIFLSIFDVHLNRAPVSGEVAYVKFVSGKFFDARDNNSIDKNQRQDVGIKVTEPGLPGKIMVRQSTGAIARRIVCPVGPATKLARGEKYGMIKFGSRTTIFISSDQAINWKVKIGDRVKAGCSVIAAKV